jgi:hypothetical protein
MSEFEMEIPAELMKRIEELPDRSKEHPYKQVVVEILKTYGKRKSWKHLAKVLQEYYKYPVNPETLRKWYAREVAHDPKTL